MYYIGFCPVCVDGPLGIYVCGENHMIIMCDECDSIWLDTELSGEPYFPTQHDFRCPYSDDSLYSHGAHWASKDEIVQKGWWDAVKGEGASMQD